MAVDTDPTLAEAHYELSILYYALEDNFSALMAARRAYEEDAYLSRADAILEQLFWTHYDLEQFTDARRWCDEGKRRFPDDQRFVECRLWLMITPGAEPDIPAAWDLLQRYEELLPETGSEFDAHLARMIVGGVIGRADLTDSASSVLESARAGADIDPDQELAGYEGIMRTVMGDHDSAIHLLRRYVAINPGHFLNPNGDLHWWWRPLRDDPEFRAVSQPK
jgi:tetratricopeptide (TPR) repeat protein